MLCGSPVVRDTAQNTTTPTHLEFQDCLCGDAVFAVDTQAVRVSRAKCPAPRAFDDFRGRTLFLTLLVSVPQVEFSLEPDRLYPEQSKRNYSGWIG